MGQLFRVATSWVLWEVANFAADLNRTCAGLAIAGQNLCEGSFAGTVSTNQPDLVTLLNPKVHTRHQGPGANADLKISYSNHVLAPGGIGE